MKLRILTLTIATGLVLWSCEDSNNSDSPLGGLTAASITGVNTTNADEFCCWKSGSTIQFTSTNGTFTNWNVLIGEASGYLRQHNGNPLQWRGAIMYQEKDKYCKETVYIDSVAIDFTMSESGFGNGVYRTGSTQYDKYTTPGPINMTEYYIRPEGGINTINILDANNAYQYRFKTRTTDNINSWKIEQMPQGWMNSNGKITMLTIPILYSLFQQ